MISSKSNSELNQGNSQRDHLDIWTRRSKTCQAHHTPIIDTSTENYRNEYKAVIIYIKPDRPILSNPSN